MPRKPRSEFARINKSILLIATAGKLRHRVDVLLPRKRWTALLKELEAMAGHRPHFGFGDDGPIQLHSASGIVTWIWRERD